MIIATKALHQPELSAPGFLIWVILLTQALFSLALHNKTGQKQGCGRILMVLRLISAIQHGKAALLLAADLKLFMLLLTMACYMVSELKPPLAHKEKMSTLLPVKKCLPLFLRIHFPLLIPAAYTFLLIVITAIVSIMT